MKTKREKLWKNMVASCILIAGVVLLLYLRQRFGAHGQECFVPEYEKITLTATTDYETIFLQTGLGEVAAKRFLQENDLQTLQAAQEDFFKSRTVFCESLIGWFTKEDKLQLNPTTLEKGTDNAPERSVANGADNVAERSVANGASDYPQFVDLQPGDVLVTLSTHSVGWRHGHAALVLDENTTVESVMWGMDSTYGRVENWLDYSNWAVLRVKEVKPELQQQVADYAEEELHGVSYHLSSGFIGEKAPKTDAPYFGVHCAYLVWYAWNRFGYDLDSDGGRLVTASDLLHSKQLEVVQLYGMDPREFMERDE